MANDVTNNPLILDTASTTATVITGDIKINAARWVVDADTAEDNEVILKNAAGRVILHSKVAEIGTAANAVYPDQTNFNPPLRAKGLIMHTLAAGTTLYVYHDGPNPIATT